jgi:hypothetical protein
MQYNKKPAWQIDLAKIPYIDLGFIISEDSWYKIFSHQGKIIVQDIVNDRCLVSYPKIESLIASQESTNNYLFIKQTIKANPTSQIYYLQTPDAFMTAAAVVKTIEALIAKHKLGNPQHDIILSAIWYQIKDSISFIKEIRDKVRDQEEYKKFFLEMIGEKTTFTSVASSKKLQEESKGLGR